MKIGLIVIATGKYHQFVPPLIDSARKHFLPGHDVKICVLRDGGMTEHYYGSDYVSRVDHLPWPLPTLMRYHWITQLYQHGINLPDYLFYTDADMLFENTVGDEILSNGLTLTQHPGFYGKAPRELPHCNNGTSNAYVPLSLRKHYFAGGFQGGKTEAFLEMSKDLSERIACDLKRHVIATWHDESNLNWYAAQNPGKVTKMLTPEYCWSHNHPHKGLTPRLVALDKNHEEVRG